MKKRITLLWLVLCLLLAACASADPLVDVSRTGKITVTAVWDGEPLKDVRFLTYKVMDILEDGSLALANGFDSEGFDINHITDVEKDSKQLADTFAAQVSDKTPLYDRRTNALGVMTLTDVPVGVYLILGEDRNPDPGHKDVFSPILVSFPQKNGLFYSYEDISIAAKHERIPLKVPLKVRKLWFGDVESDRPGKIIVYLHMDDNPEALYTIELTSENGWSWTSPEPLPAGHIYTIYEVLDTATGAKYSVSYSPGSIVLTETEFLLTVNNALGKTPPSGGNYYIPQTGLPWWPVYAMALAGMVLFLIGWGRRRRWSKKHEEP